jgi:glycosyltransferase involved in cell wall biosynthesis
MAVRALRWRPTLIHANDLEALPIGVLVKALCAARLIYDAHELWFDVYRNSFPKWMYWLITGMERVMVKRADCVVTVSDGVARHMANNLNIAEPVVVRNVPSQTVVASHEVRLLHTAASLSADRHILLVLGMVCPGRGVETLIRAMPHVDQSASVVFLGDEDVTVKCPDGRSYLDSVEDLAGQLGVRERVRFVPSVPPDDVLRFAICATIGLALIEPTCMSYCLCLPNKLFQYVQVGIPVVASDLQDMAALVCRYDLGEVVPPGNVAAIATAINSLLRDPSKMARYRNNACRAALELNWEKEQMKLVTLYDGLVSRRAAEPAACA